MQFLKRFRWGFLTAICLIVVTGVGAGATVKDTLVVAQGVDAISMDPALHTTFATGTILFQIYDPLITRGSDGTIRPALAESWENLDETTWQFRLKKGIRFSNGEDFNAESVKFSLERVLDPATKAPNRSRIASIERVDVVDEYTVNIVTKNPAPTLLHGLTEDAFCSLMVPPKYVSENPGLLTSKPVGTGPYELVEWVKDDHVTLRAKKDYWGGASEIENVIFRPIPEISTRLSELKSGGIDLTADVPPEQADDLKKIKGVTVLSSPTDRLFYITVNTLEDGPLKDKRVRQAMMYAIDVEAINQGILGCMAKRTAVNLPVEAFGYDDSLAPYPYDPEKAAALLKEAGYEKGFSVPFLSRNGRYIKDKEIVEACAGYLAQVGIECRVEFVEGGIWAGRTENHGRKGLSYPGWSGRDADLVFYPQLYSGQTQSYVADPALDEMIMAARTTMDQQKRLEIYKRICAYVYEEMYQLPLFQSPAIYGVNADFDWQPRNDDIIDLRGTRFK